MKEDPVILRFYRSWWETVGCSFRLLTVEWQTSMVSKQERSYGKEVLVDSFLFNWKINNIETVLDTWIGKTELQYTLMDDSNQELGFH